MTPLSQGPASSDAYTAVAGNATNTLTIPRRYPYPRRMTRSVFRALGLEGMLDEASPSEYTTAVPAVVDHSIGSIIAFETDQAAYHSRIARGLPASVPEPMRASATFRTFPVGDPMRYHHLALEVDRDFWETLVSELQLVDWLHPAVKNLLAGAVTREFKMMAAAMVNTSAVAEITRLAAANHVTGASQLNAAALFSSNVPTAFLTACVATSGVTPHRDYRAPMSQDINSHPGSRWMGATVAVVWDYEADTITIDGVDTAEWGADWLGVTRAFQELCAGVRFTANVGEPDMADALRALKLPRAVVASLCVDVAQCLRARTPEDFACSLAAALLHVDVSFSLGGVDSAVDYAHALLAGAVAGFIPCVGDEAPPPEFNPMDLLWAFATGEASGAWPRWMRVGLTVVRRGAVLSAALLAGAKVSSGSVREWASLETLATPESIRPEAILSGARDLLSRLREAWRVGGTTPLFEDTSPEAAMARAGQLISRAVDEIDVGETESRLIAVERRRDVVARSLREMRALFSNPRLAIPAQRLHVELSRMQGRLETLRNALGRRPPYTVLLYSEPQLGKTLLTKVVAKTVGAAMGRNFGPESIWYVMPDTPHNDGYVASEYPVAVLDELASTLSPDLLALMGQMVLTWVNPTPKPLTMAELSAKGCVYAAADCVIGCTNIKDLQADKTNVGGGAPALARFPIVLTVEVTPAFLKDEKLNTSALKPDTDPDTVWVITIERLKVKQTGAKTAETTYQNVYRGPLSGATRWIAADVKRHVSRNDNVNQFLETALDAAVVRAVTATVGDQHRLFTWASLVALMAIACLGWCGIASACVCAAGATGVRAIATDAEVTTVQVAVADRAMEVATSSLVTWCAVHYPSLFRITRGATRIAGAAYEKVVSRRFGQVVAAFTAGHLALRAWAALRPPPKHLLATAFFPTEKPVPDVKGAVRADPVGWEAKLRASYAPEVAAGGGLTTDTSRAPRPVVRVNTPAQRSMSLPDAVRKVSDATYAVIVHYEGGDSSPATAFRIRGDMFVTNAHVMRGETSGKITLLPRSDAERTISAVAHPLSPANTWSPPNSDLLFFYLAVPPGPDLTTLIDARGTPVGNHPAYVWARDGEARLPALTTMVGESVERVEYHNVPSVKYTARGYWTRMPTAPGASGGPVLVDLGVARCVIGLSTGDLDGRGWVHPLDIDVVEAAQAMFALRRGGGRAYQIEPCVGDIIAAPPHPMSQGFNVPGSPFGPTSPFEYAGRSRLGTGGTVMRVARTPIADVVQPLLDKWGAEFAAPAGRGVPVPVEGGWGWTSPWSYAMGKMSPTTHPSWEDIAWAVDDYCAPLKSEGVAYRMLTFDEAILGVPGTAIGPMDLTKSAGPGWPLQKGAYVSVIAGKVAPSPALRDAVDEILSGLQAGTLRELTIRGQLKEEVVTHKKAASAATRVFSVLPFPALIVMRMVLGMVDACFFANPIPATECAIGVNMASPVQAGALADYLLAKSGRVQAADGEAQDKRFFAWLREAEARVLCHIASLCGADAFALDRIRSVVMWGMYAAYHYDGDVYRFHQGEASGKYGTSRSQSLGTSVMNRVALRWAWADAHPEIPLPTYRSLYSLVTYGDDQVAGVASGALGLRALQRGYASFGFVITDDSKGEIHHDDRDLSEVDFLKRQIICVGGLWRGALSPKSILRSVAYAVRRPDGIAPADRDALAVENAMAEAYLHGREFFEELRGALAPAFPLTAPGYHCEPRGRSFDWDWHDSRFRSDTMRTWDAGGQIEYAGRFRALVGEEEAGGPTETVSTGGPGESQFVLLPNAAATGMGDFPGVAAQQGDDPLLRTQVGIAGFPANSSTLVNVWSAYLSQAIVRRHLANVRLLSGTLELTITVSSPPGTYGLGYFGVIGFPSWRGQQGVQSTQQATQLPGVMVDFSMNSATVVCVPLGIPGLLNLDVFNTSTTMDPLTSPTWANRLQFMVVKAVGSLGLSSAAPTVTIRGRLCPGYKTVGMGHSAWITPSVGERRGPVERGANFASQVASALKSVPFLSAGATAAEYIAKGVGGVAALMGWSAPLVFAAPEPMAQLPWYNAASGGAAVVSQPVALSPTSETPIDAQQLGFPAEDELSIAHIVGHWGIIWGSKPGVQEWSSSIAGGTVIGAIPVSPCAYDGTDIYPTSRYAITPLLFASGFAAAWSGGLEYEVLVAAPTLVAGALRVAYIPQDSNDASTADLDITSYPGVIMDLRESRSVRFVVPWQSPYGVLPTATAFTECPAVGYGVVAQQTGFAGNALPHGNLYVIVERPLSCAGTVAAFSVGVVVRVRGGPDFRLYGTNDTFGITIQATVGELIPGGVPPTLSETGAVTVAPLIEGTRQDSRYNSGDYLLSLRPIIKARRFRFVCVPPGLTSVVGPAVLTLAVPAFGWYDHNQAPSQVGAVSSYPHPFDLVATAYTGMRGSTRWSFRAGPGGGGAATGPLGTYDASLVAGVTTTQRVSQATSGAQAANTVGVSVVQNCAGPFPRSGRVLGYGYDDLAGRCMSFSVPYTSMYAWEPTGAGRPSTGASSTPQRTVVATVQGRITAVNASLDTIEVFFEAGEDIALVGFTATPLIATVARPT